jgi:hypothetical protein
MVPETTETIRLKVIPEPDPNTRTIFVYDGDGTVVMSGFASGLSMNCGKCDSPLVRGLNRGQITDVVLRCKGCGAFNET